MGEQNIKMRLDAKCEYELNCQLLELAYHLRKKIRSRNDFLVLFQSTFRNRLMRSRD